MASPLINSTENASSFKPTQSVGSTKNVEQQLPARRSGNYQPSIWNDSYIQSLKSVYTGEQHTRRAEKLKKDVTLLLEEVTKPLDQLMLIDDLQRLGVSYHFEDVIKTMLSSIFINQSSTDDHQWKEDSLFAMALQFRLLRQHGFHVPQGAKLMMRPGLLILSSEVFGEFKDKVGNFKPWLSTNTKGLLSLYEASYLSIEGENIVDDAKEFATKHLMENLHDDNMDQLLAIQVRHALELPLHWRMLRSETRWFIELVYAKRTDVNPTLLELAKLDFNMVQATHQKDLKVASRWWRKMAVGEKMTFGRDRLVEVFFWTVGIIFEHEQGYCRRMFTKICAMITIIDDVYDVYGTLDELILFTDAIERWDINLMEQLPDYMKICFLALYNSINKMVYVALKEQDVDVTSYMKKAWADLCKSYLVEAKWFYSDYTPSLDEYLNNACISVGAPLSLIHGYCFITKPIEKEVLECIERYPTIIHCISLILRLADDLGTSSDELERGDVSKSIQCYMHETGASKEVAREYIKKLIDETWKKVNEDRYRASPFSQTFIETAMNLARTSQFVYLHGDGHGAHKVKEHIEALLIEPIQL